MSLLLACFNITFYTSASETLQNRAESLGFSCSIAVPLQDFIPRWFLFSTYNQKRSLRKHMSFLKFVTFTQTHFLQVHSRDTWRNCGEVQNHWVIKNGKTFYDSGWNHLKGMKQKELLPKPNPPEPQKNNNQLWQTSGPQVGVNFMESFSSEISNQNLQTRFHSTVKGGINILCEWRQKRFQQGNLPSSKWNCFLLILCSKDWRE